MSISTFTRTFSLFSVCILAIALSFGCEKEVLVKETKFSGIQAETFNSIETPSYPCASAATQNLVDGSTVLGTVSLVNDPSDFYLQFQLNQYKFLEEFYLYNGAVGTVPLDTDGFIHIEEFSSRVILDRSSNAFTLTIPLNRMPACADIVVYAKVSTRNIFGQVTGYKHAWMSGVQISNGFKTSFCYTNC